MTWPLSGWIFSSSSSSSMEEDDEDTQFYDDEDQTTLNDEDDVQSSSPKDIGNNGQIIGNLVDEKDREDLNRSESNNLSEDDEQIPTAIAISGDAPNNVVTVAVPGTAVSDGMKRRRFQRRATIWTNQDEIELLRGFLEFTSENGISGHRLHQQELTTFHNAIKSKIRINCAKNQLIEKIRRLRRKYLKVSSKIDSDDKITFRSPHDRSIFKISRRIWGRNSKKSQTSAEDNISNKDIADANSNYGAKRESSRDESEERGDLQPSRKRYRTRLQSGGVSNWRETSAKESSSVDDIGKISGLVEEVARGCLSPFFKELMSNWLTPVVVNSGGGEGAEERWRKQQEMEMEVYVKRLELVQDEIRVALEELKSRGGGRR